MPAVRKIARATTTKAARATIAELPAPVKELLGKFAVAQIAQVGEEFQ